MLHLCPHLVVPVTFILAIVFKFAIHMFIGHLDICFLQCLFRYFTQLSLGFYDSFLLICRNLLEILELYNNITFFCLVYEFQVSFPNLWFVLCTLWTVSFNEQKILTEIMSDFFPFVVGATVKIFKERIWAASLKLRCMGAVFVLPCPSYI